MKIFISYGFTDSPWGGGNQFLKNLKRRFLEDGLIAESPEDADVILYNGHQFIEQTSFIKKAYPDKIFVHRMDGLQKLYNNLSDTRQDLAIDFNRLASATVFQSEWSKNKFKEFNFDPQKSTIIPNAADPKTFFPQNHSSKNGRINLLCTSFSDNLNKGFQFYKTLDKALDFDKFNFTFIGNKPSNIEYKNIVCLPPKTTKEIAGHLKKTDIFVSATVNDCCSNSIIEALSSGVPVLAKNSGGNPELVKEGGLVFNELEDFLYSLEKIASDVDFYSSNINIKTIKEVAQDYLEFFRCI